MNIDFYKENATRDPAPSNLTQLRLQVAKFRLSTMSLCDFAQDDTRLMSNE